jgi:hypothetical protein
MGGQVFWAGPDGGVPPEWVSLGEVVEDTVTTPAAPDSELLVGWELLKDRPVRVDPSMLFEIKLAPAIEEAAENVRAALQTQVAAYSWQFQLNDRQAAWLLSLLPGGHRRSGRPGSRARVRRRYLRAARYEARTAGLGEVTDLRSVDRLADRIRGRRALPWRPY